MIAGAIQMMLRLRMLALVAMLAALICIAAPPSALGQEEQGSSQEPQKEQQDKEEEATDDGTAGNVVEGGGVQKQGGDSVEPDEPTDVTDDEVPEKPGSTSQESAGNVAEPGAEDDAPAGDEAPRPAGGANVAESERRESAQRDRERRPGSGLSERESGSERRLPRFAEDQPGFIPDIPPTDLFEQQREGQRQELYLFESPLGEERLNPGEAGSVIGSNAQRLSGRLQDNYARVVVPDGTIEGSTETKQFHIEGGLIIYYQDVTISADVADIDEKNEVAHLTGDVNIVDPKYRLKTDELSIFFNDKQFHASGFVTFSKVAEGGSMQADLSLPKKDRLREYFASQQFELFSQQLHYDWDSLEMTAIGSVRLVHPSFNGTMERLDYNDETKDYVIEGSVVLEVTDYGWIFANQLVEPDDEQKVRAITDGRTKITCDRLVYSEESAVAQFYTEPGKEVEFNQPKRKITASYIEVNDNTKDFYAESGENKQVVFHQDDGQWLIEGGLINEESVAAEVEDMLAGEVTTSADVLAYNFDRKRLELEGQVSVQGSGKLLTADTLVQDETSQYFLLQGNVKIVPEIDSQILAAQVFVDTQNDVITFVGLVEGKMTSEDIPTSETAQATGREIDIQQGVFQQSGLPAGSNRTARGNVAEN